METAEGFIDDDGLRPYSGDGDGELDELDSYESGVTLDGSTKEIELHHPIPVSLGGKCVIPLCSECHGKAHGMERKNISELTKKGLKRAKDKGRRLGRPTFGFTSVRGKWLPNEDYEELKK